MEKLLKNCLKLNHGAGSNLLKFVKVILKLLPIKFPCIFSVIFKFYEWMRINADPDPQPWYSQVVEWEGFYSSLSIR